MVNKITNKKERRKNRKRHFRRIRFLYRITKFVLVTRFVAVPIYKIIGTEFPIFQTKQDLFELVNVSLKLPPEYKEYRAVESWILPENHKVLCGMIEPILRIVPIPVKKGKFTEFVETLELFKVDETVIVTQNFDPTIDLVLKTRIVRNQKWYLLLAQAYCTLGDKAQILIHDAANYKAWLKELILMIPKLGILLQDSAQLIDGNAYDFISIYSDISKRFVTMVKIDYGRSKSFISNAFVYSKRNLIIHTENKLKSIKTTSKFICFISDNYEDVKKSLVIILKKVVGKSELLFLKVVSTRRLLFGKRVSKRRLLFGKRVSKRRLLFGKVVSKSIIFVHIIKRTGSVILNYLAVIGDGLIERDQILACQQLFGYIKNNLRQSTIFIRVYDSFSSRCSHVQTFTNNLDPFLLLGHFAIEYVQFLFNMPSIYPAIGQLVKEVIIIIITILLAIIKYITYYPIKLLKYIAKLIKYTIHRISPAYKEAIIPLVQVFKKFQQSIRFRSILTCTKAMSSARLYSTKIESFLKLKAARAKNRKPARNLGNMIKLNSARVKNTIRLDSARVKNTIRLDSARVKNTIRLDSARVKNTVRLDSSRVRNTVKLNSVRVKNYIKLNSTKVKKFIGSRMSKRRQETENNHIKEND